MNKHTHKQATPAQVLQHSAEQLALKHQQRLHQMTREAVYGKTAVKKQRVFSLLKVAVPLFSLVLIMFVWQEQPPQQTAMTLAAIEQNPQLPPWVKDAEVPLAMLENLEFYQWLDQQLEDKNHA